MTWQPISTAPKDGTYVLLWGRSAGTPCEVGQWGTHMLVPRWIDSSECTLWYAPTHWMPCPEPPEVEG